MDRIEIESKDFLYVRQQLQQLADSLVDKETTNEEERKQSKEELERWLQDVWSNFSGNIRLTDNPNFNFNEPIQLREPVDTSLQAEVLETQQTLRQATEELCETRLEQTEALSTIISDMLEAQTETVQNLTIVDNSLPKNVPAEVTQENTKQVKIEYDDAVKMLSNLETTLSNQISDYENILDIAK